MTMPLPWRNPAQKHNIHKMEANSCYCRGWAPLPYSCPIGQTMGTQKLLYWMISKAPSGLPLYESVDYAGLSFTFHATETAVQWTLAPTGQMASDRRCLCVQGLAQWKTTFSSVILVPKAMSPKLAQERPGKRKDSAAGPLRTQEVE